jgi:hypothetical protein
MTNYSICYLDASGRTRSTEFLPFSDNAVATNYAMIGLVRNPIVEVWRANGLIARLLQAAPTSTRRPARSKPNADALARHRARTAAESEWDNEGGAARIASIR